MKPYSGGKKPHDLFPRDEVILGNQDRRKKVSDKQLSTFPFNVIGWIKSKSKISSSNKPSPQAKGTGFLISQSLVLTSAHNFVIRDEDNGEVIQYLPLSFSTFQLGENGLVQRIWRIKVVKLNFTFIGLMNKIVMLKNMYYSEEDILLKQRYCKKILDLEEESVQHDFALLKLEQPISRPQYFELSHNLQSKCELAVVGYVHHYGTQFTLFIHSNIFNSINNGKIDYDIDTKSGQSGCPVYMGGDSRKVVGIHKAYDPQKHLNFATLITESVIDILKLWALQMDSSFGGLNQNPRTNNQQDNQQNRFKQSTDLKIKGDELRENGQFEEALDYYHRALGLTQKLKGKESIQHAKILCSIGLTHFYQHIYQWSLDIYIQELTIHENIYNNETLQKANSLAHISVIYSKLDKPKQANEYYKSAMSIYEKIGTISIICPYTLNSIALMQDLQDKSKQALEYYDRAMIIFKKIGKESIGQANTLNNIGNVYKKQEKLEQALEYYEKSVAIHQNIRKDTLQWIDTVNNIGDVLAKQGKLRKALGYHDGAQIIRDRIGKKPVQWADRIKQSLELYYKQLADYEKAGIESKLWAYTLRNIGTLYQYQGLNEKARQFSQKYKKMINKLE